MVTHTGQSANSPTERESALVTIHIVDDEARAKRCSAKRTYQTPRSLLVKHSRRFALHFQKPNINEATIRGNNSEVAYAPTVHALHAEFDIFMQWLRFQYEWELKCKTTDKLDWSGAKVPFTGLFENGEPFGIAENFDLMYTADMVRTCVHFYLFGKDYEVPRLQRDATDRIIWALYQHTEGEHDRNCWFRVGPMDVLDSVYSKTSPGDPLRRLFVEAFSAFPHKKIENDIWLKPKATCNEFFADVVSQSLAFVDKIGLESVAEDGTYLRALRPCRYHGHRNKAEKAQCDGSRVKWNNQGQEEHSSDTVPEKKTDFYGIEMEGV